MTAAADQDPKRARAGAWAARALGWWLDELRGLGRDIAERLALGLSNPLVIEAGERYWLLQERRRPLGQIDRAAADPETQYILRRLPAATRRRAVIVEIPRDRVLAKRITMPDAAPRALDRMLRFELARHFPFPTGRVHFAHRILGRSANGSGVDVEIVAVPREIVGEIRDELAAADMTVRRIVVTGGAAPIPLPAVALGPGTPARRGLDRALAIVLAIAAAAALLSPIVRDRVRLAALDREIATLQPQAQVALDARKRARSATERIIGPLQLRTARPPLVAVLDALTAAVPDGAWLLSLHITGREIVLDGLSPSAAATVLALEQSHAFSAVAFRSSIARDAQSGLEHFQLVLELAEPKP